MTASTWYPIVSVRLAPGALDAIAQIRQVDVVMTSIGTTVQWALWSNVAVTTNLTGGTFANHGSSTNVQINQGATAFTPTSTCYQVASGLLTSTNQTTAAVQIELNKYFSQIGRNSFTQVSDIMTLAIYSTTAIGGGGTTLQALLSWNELL